MCWQTVMGKVRYFAIVFNNDKTVYHPGEQVTGQCQLELKSDMKMRALHMFMRGVAKVDQLSLCVDLMMMRTDKWLRCRLSQIASY